MKYALVIMPNDELIAYVKNLKLQLEQKIGWYHSVNALAHISICEFETDESGLDEIMVKIKEIADFEKGQYVYLDRFNKYESTFFIQPTVYAKAFLKDVFRRTISQLQHVVKDLQHITIDPHITIGRKLDEQQLQQAKAMFTALDKSFLCMSFTLRRFSPEIGQYEAIATFPFGNKTREEGQLTLF